MDRISVLDHGYVQLVESWGSDERIIEAARMSTQKGFEGWGVEETCAKCGGSGTNEPENGPGSLCKVCRGRRLAVNVPGDEKLLRYLWANKHHTPFEMAGFTIEVQAPIFVFREWHRHRTQSYNEASARYAPLPDLHYMPTVERCLMGGGHLTKQAGAHGGKQLLGPSAEIWLARLSSLYEMSESVYAEGIEIGVPKEIARCAMLVSRCTKMRASANLRNWLGFLALRAEPHAQWEIQQYAWTVHGILKELFPRTVALFDEGRSK
jgi:thymidylate synthase (FAD)